MQQNSRDPRLRAGDISNTQRSRTGRDRSMNQSARGPRPRVRDRSNARQPWTGRDRSATGLARPPQARLNPQRERGRIDRNRGEEDEMQQRRGGAATHNTGQASRWPTADEFEQIPPLPRDLYRLSRPFEQYEVDIGNTTVANRLSQSYQPGIFVDRNRSVSQEARREEGLESGNAQYQRQPSRTEPMRYPNVMAHHSFADDGQVSPLEEVSGYAPAYKVGKAHVVGHADHHWSHRVVVGNASDLRDSLSETSNRTRYAQSESQSSRGRSASSPYVGSGWSTIQTSLSGYVGNEERGAPYRTVPIVYSPRHQKKTVHEEEVQLRGQGSSRPLPDPERFADAYKMLTDSSRIEGGRALKYKPAFDDLWMV